MGNKRENAAVDAALRRVLGNGNDRLSKDCPDDNTVNAYLENRLHPAEKDRYEKHASSCAHCQELLALSMNLSAAAESENLWQTAPKRDTKVLFHFSFPLSALALIVVAVAAGIVFFREFREPERAPASMEKAQSRPLLPPTQSQPEAPKIVDSVEPAPQRKSAASEPARGARVLDRSRVSPELSKRSQLSESRSKTANLPENKPKSSVDSVSTQASPPAALPATPAVPREAQEIRASDEGRDRRNAVVAGGLKKKDGEKAAENILVMLSAQEVIDVFSQRFFPAESDSAMRQERTPEMRLRKLGAADAGLRQDNAAQQQKQQPSQQTSPAPKTEMVNYEARLAFEPVRKLGDRTFYRLSGYWIDSQCGQHPKVEVVEITSSHAVYENIQKTFPQIVDLRTSGLPVLLHWNGKNYVIRF